MTALQVKLAVRFSGITERLDKHYHANEPRWPRVAGYAVCSWFDMSMAGLQPDNRMWSSTGMGWLQRAWRDRNKPKVVDYED